MKLIIKTFLFFFIASFAFNIQQVSSKNLNLYNLDNIAIMPFPDNPQLADVQEIMNITTHEYLFAEPELLTIYASSIMISDLPEDLLRLEDIFQSEIETKHAKIQDVLGQFLSGHIIMSGGEVVEDKSIVIDGNPGRYIAISTSRRSINFIDYVIAIYNQKRVHTWKIIAPGSLNKDVTKNIFLANVKKIRFPIR